MTNIFHKKDGLADAVKSVMEVNQFHREAEAQVNEKFGVVSRKALPHEQQASWDSEFNKIISEGAMKRMSGMSDGDGGMETYKKKPEDYSPKQMMMAKIAGNPKKIDAQDLAALRAGKKMDEEEQIDELKGYQGKKGQELLKAVQKRAFMRLSNAADKKDIKTTKKYSDVMNNAWDRMNDVYEEEQIDEMDALDKKRMTSTAAQVNKAGKSDSAPEIRKAAGAMQRSRVNIDKASDRLDRGGEMSGPTPKKVAIEEKKLTDAEMAKREEIVKSMKDKSAEFEKRYPGRGEKVMYATATKQAKELAEESLDSIQEEIATNLYAELNYVMEHHGEEAGDEWIANLSEEQLAIMENLSEQGVINAAQAREKYVSQSPPAQAAVRTAGTKGYGYDKMMRQGQARSGSSMKANITARKMRAAKDYAGGNRKYGEFGNDAKFTSEPATMGSWESSQVARRDPKNTNLRYGGYNQGREGDRPLTQKVGPAKQAAQPVAKPANLNPYGNDRRAGEPKRPDSSTQAAAGNGSSGGTTPRQAPAAQRTSSAPRASSGGTPMSTSAYASQRAGITSKNLGGASSVIAGRRALAQKALNTTGGGAKGAMMRQRAERDLNGPAGGGR